MTSIKKINIKNKKIHLQNIKKKSELKTYLKKINTLIIKNEKNLVKEKYREITSKLDNYAGKKIIHKNKAARHKIKLNIKIKKMLLSN
jgi:small subunit ribosomal protein S20